MRRQDEAVPERLAFSFLLTEFACKFSSLGASGRWQPGRASNPLSLLSFFVLLHIPFHSGPFRIYCTVMSATLDPLVAPPPVEVPLKDAPLVRVIAQLRFPEVLSVEQRNFVAPFQEAIRSTYPVLRQEQTQDLLLGPGVVAPAKPQIAWRFGDLDGHWRVSLTPDFLALETTRYVSRSDFFGRLKAVAQALDEHIEPAQLDRLGVRYIDRITGDAVDDIARLVRPEVRGITGTIAATHATHALSESLFEVGDARVLARWGVLPPGATVDPAALEPAREKSWLLDLDMFSASPKPFVVDQVVEQAQRYAERIYTIFRWAVTDEFLVRYGGNP
jgi:uncharacterized protein (TIGR04255 family)